jgi:hypothetical protein
VRWSFIFLFRSGKRRERPLCWKLGFWSNARGASAAVRNYGHVVQVHIIVDRDTGLLRGFAFAEITNDAEADKTSKALCFGLIWNPRSLQDLDEWKESGRA